MASPSVRYPDIRAQVEAIDAEDAATSTHSRVGRMSGRRQRSTFRGRTRSRAQSPGPEMAKQTPRKIRQKIYRQALQELQTNAQQKEDWNLSWSEKTHKTLAENFGILAKAEKTALDSVAVEVGGGGGKGGGGTKRAREESPSSESDSDVLAGRLALRGAVSDAPPSILPCVRSHVKRVKRGTYTKTHLPIKLEILQPQPIQQDFPPHTDRDQFVSTYFGVHDLNKGEFHQPWALDFAPEFVNYVELVAEPDLESGGWDALLRETGLRISLVKAVLMKILQDKILDEDLFGTEKRESEMLHHFERSFFDR